MAKRDRVPLRSGALDYDVEGVSLETGLECKDPTLTKESEASETDINLIMKRFLQTGVAPNMAGRTQPVSGNFVDAPDLRGMLDFRRAAEQQFAKLPEKVRMRVGNTLEGLEAFLSDESNLEEAVGLGLVEKPAPVASEKPVETSATPASKSS